MYRKREILEEIPTVGSGGKCSELPNPEFYNKLGRIKGLLRSDRSCSDAPEKTTDKHFVLCFAIKEYSVSARSDRSTLMKI